MLLLFAVQIASAQPREAGRIVAGEDLAAWRALYDERAPGRDAVDDTEGLFDFLHEFPSSPLAELAYRRLLELGQEVPADQWGSVGRIAHSYRDHEASLRRGSPDVVVASLDLEPEIASTASLQDEPALSLQFEAGAGVSDGPAVYAGVGWQVGMVAISVRGVMARELHVGGAFKVLPWDGVVQPFAELSYLGPTPNGELVGGMRWVLADGYLVEVAVGANKDLDAGDLSAASRVGLVLTF